MPDTLGTIAALSVLGLAAWVGYSYGLARPRPEDDHISWTWKRVKDAEETTQRLRDDRDCEAKTGRPDALSTREQEAQETARVVADRERHLTNRATVTPIRRVR